MFFILLEIRFTFRKVVYSFGFEIFQFVYTIHVVSYEWLKHLNAEPLLSYKNAFFRLLNRFCSIFVLMIDYEGHASGSLFYSQRHIDMLYSAKVVEGAYDRRTGYIEVNVMNEKLCIGIWVLFSNKRRRLFCHVIVHFIYFDRFLLLFFLLSSIFLELIYFFSVLCVGFIRFLLHGLISHTCRRDF